MRNGDVALRLVSVLSVAGFIALAASLYEVDRREKSSLATGEHALADIEQRIQLLSNQFHILNNQLTAQVMATERQVQALDREVQALRDQHESRLKELEDGLRVRRVQPAPPAPR
jgi:predicted  nucleic acid-binding Zn-ribbon protein